MFPTFKYLILWFGNYMNTTIQRVMLCFVSILLLLTYGNNIVNSANSPALLLVSTLDGRINAVSLEDSSLQWSVPLGSNGLVSSNIPVFQSPDNEDEEVHIIPSLDGELYEFSGRHLKRLFITPDSLLSTSYRLSDRIVVVGARTSELFGVRMSDGKTLYRCTYEGCSGLLNNGDNNGDSDTLAVRKTVLILRAIDIRTGLESWNYSVGSHDVHLVSYADSIFMRDRLLESENDQDSAKYNFKMQLGSNVVEVEKYDDESAVNPLSYFNRVNRKKFALASPIAKAWFVADSNNLKEIDFVNDEVFDEDEDDAYVLLGQFNGLPYVHQSAGVAKYYRNSKTNLPAALVNQQLALDGDSPLLFSAVSRTPLIRPSDGAESSALALYSQPYPFDSHEADAHPQGVLYHAKKCKRNAKPSDTISRTIFLPWAIIALTGALIAVLTVFLGKIWRRIKHYFVPESSSKSVVSVAKDVTQTLNENENKAPIAVPSIDLDLNASATEFGDNGLNGTPASVEIGSDTSTRLSNRSNTVSSRYTNDFVTLAKLGKGGFGVVYRARNKIDDVEYAIKIVPIKANQQCRAQREVRSWALLDHTNIVRFHQAWFEDSLPVQDSPRPGGGYGETEEHDDDDDDEDHFDDEGVIGSTHETSNINFTTDSSNILSGELSLLNTPPSKFSAMLNKDSSFNVVFTSKENVDASSCGVIFKSGSGDENKVSFSDSTELEKQQKTSGTSSSRTKNNSNSSEGTASNQLIYFCIQAQLCEMTLRDWIDCEIGSKTIRSSYSAAHENSMNEEQKSYHATLVDLFSQLLCGLDHVHGQGIIHRDIKPTNIFLVLRNGISVLKIGDFGLASLPFSSTSRASNVSSGCESSPLGNNFSNSAHLGTLLYMSPEQEKRSSTTTLTPKVDIYSSGLVGIEMFVPFGTDHERVNSLLAAKRYCTDTNRMKMPKCLLELEERFPSLKELIIDKMLKQNPKDRPSAEEILTSHLVSEAWRVTLPRKPSNLSPLYGRRNSNMDDRSSNASSDRF